MSLDTFTEAFIDCLLWSEIDCDEDGNMRENFSDYCADDLSPEALAEIRKDCASFYAEYEDAIENEADRAGHDFCLTRNGHGAGFWDGYWPEPLASELTDASKAYGTIGLYLHGGTLYHHN